MANDEVGKVVLSLELDLGDLKKQFKPFSKRMGTELSKLTRDAFTDTFRNKDIKQLTEGIGEAMFSAVRRDMKRTTEAIRGIRKEIVSLGSDLSHSLSGVAGARGTGEVSREMTTFVPLLGNASGALQGFSAIALKTAARFKLVGVVIGITAISTIATIGKMIAGLQNASQDAIKFESTIGRLNMQLQGGSRDFMDWARAQGLAKQTAAQMGVTYGTLLSSFISDIGELNEQTKQITHATRVVASNTGRSIEDVMERMQSGVSGDTKAINFFVAAA